MTNLKFNDLWHGSMLAALTACMAVGLVDVARSASPDEPASVKVAYGDLNLASEQGTRTLYARIAAAARQVCGADFVDLRDLPAFTAERSCERQAIAKAVNDVQDTRMASVRARHDHG